MRTPQRPQELHGLRAEAHQRTAFLVLELGQPVLLHVVGVALLPRSVRRRAPRRSGLGEQTLGEGHIALDDVVHEHRGVDRHVHLVVHLRGHDQGQEDGRTATTSLEDATRRELEHADLVGIRARVLVLGHDDGAVAARVEAVDPRHAIGDDGVANRKERNGRKFIHGRLLLSVRGGKRIDHALFIQKKSSCQYMFRIKKKNLHQVQVAALQ